MSLPVLVSFGQRLRVIAWALLVLVLSSWPLSRAAAQAPPPPDPAAGTQEAAGAPGIAPMSLGQLLDPSITTASRVLERATEAPATVYVITSVDIRARGYSTLTDVLRDLPGMESVEQYYSELGTLVPVRGVVGNNKIVLLINGVRMNPPGGEELTIRSDISVRFADQIEVIYGPGSTLYGQDAISAVINIKTRRPGDDTVEVVGTYGLNNALEGYASFAHTLFEHSELPLSVTAYVAGKSSNLSNFRQDFPAWWQKYDDYLKNIGRAGAPDRHDLGMNAFLRIESQNTSLQAVYRESSRSSSEGSGEGGPSPVLFFVPEAVWRDRSLVVEGQNTLRFSDAVALQSILTFNRYEVDPESRYVFPDGKGGLYLNDFKYAVGTSATIEEKLNVQLNSSSRFVVGATASNYHVIPKTSVPGGAHTDQDIVSQAGVLTYYTTNDPASKVELNRAVNLQYQQFGAYAEGAHDFNEHLRLLAGVRVDKSTRFSTIPISPRAALIVRGFGGQLTLKYIFSMAYVSPAPAFSYNIYDNGSQIGTSNPNLSPERALSNEVNVSWRTSNVLLSGSAYYNRQYDLLTVSQSGAPETVVLPNVFVNPDGTGMRRLAHSVNLGSSNGMGFDLFFLFNTSIVSGWGSYSFVDFKSTLGDVTSGLPLISRHNVRFGSTVNILRNLSLTGALVLRSTPENLTSLYDNAGVSLELPYEINAQLSYSPVDRLDLFAYVRNATDHRYALRGLSGPAVQEPRTIFGGIRFRY
jgi:outer membrane cobalamin receptor